MITKLIVFSSRSHVLIKILQTSGMKTLLILTKVMLTKYRVAQNKIPHQTICNIFATTGCEDIAYCLVGYFILSHPVYCSLRVRHVLQVSVTLSLMAPSADDATSSSVLMTSWKSHEASRRASERRATTSNYEPSGRC